MKIVTILSIMAVLLINVSISYGQGGNRTGKKGAAISGRIMSEENGESLPYAYISLHSVNDSSIISGASSKNNGEFTINNVKKGDYYLCIKYLGFDKKVVDGISIKSPAEKINMGDIILSTAETLTDEVVVEAKRKNVVYKIDRKVINVDKSLAASAGTAVDVLENVPSIEVDIDGNVSLRGSSGFIVMIDGKPSILDANDALKQIPASSIENIEIITNPSAKFDPDGTSGILNIILKKQDFHGTSGLVDLNIGQHDKIGGNILLNYKNHFYNVFLGLDYDQGKGPGTSTTKTETYSEGITSFVYSDGSRNWDWKRYGIRAGIDLDLSDNDKLSIQGNYGGRSHRSDNLLAYSEWTSLELDKLFYDSDQFWERGGIHYSGTLDYFRKFNSKGHQLTARFDLRHRTGDEESRDKMLDTDNNITFAVKNTEDGPGTRLNSQIDYVLPFGEDSKFEAGYQNRISRSEDITESFAYDLTEEKYVLEDEYSHAIDYDRNIHSLYSIYSSMIGNLGYQLGVRGEYTNRMITLQGEDEEFSIDRWDVFPSAHFSYKFSEDLQALTSYSKRIDRPRGWYLEPFETKTDAFNIRRGNPALKPEYIDSYELGILKYVGSNSISLEAFYRSTENKVERIKTPIEGEDNVFMNSIENVGTDHSLGAELMLDFQLFSYWDFLLSGSAYQYKIDTEYNGEEKHVESFNWNSRLKNTFSITKSSNFEISLNYFSPSVSSQGTSEGFLMTSAAFRQDFFDKMFSVTLKVRDIFGTGKHEFTNEGTNYYIYNYFDRDAPVFTLSLKYNFNNYKSKMRSGGNGDMEEGSEGF